MPAFGIIYASGSKMIRRIIGETQDFAPHIGPGESLLIVQSKLAPNIFEAEAAVQASTGVKPASIQCAVIDGAGVIKAIIKADPAIDSVDKLTLIPTYAGVTEQCSYNAATTLFLAPDVIVKAGEPLDRQGTIALVDTKISGGPIARPVTVTPAGEEPISP